MNLLQIFVEFSRKTVCEFVFSTNVTNVRGNDNIIIIIIMYINLNNYFFGELQFCDAVFGHSFCF